MSTAVKNVFIILGLAIVAYVGYYLFIQKEASTLNLDTDQVLIESMLTRTQVFIDYRLRLDEMDPDLTFFEDPRFLSLQSYTESVNDQPIGRTDPFAPATYSAPN